MNSLLIECQIFGPFVWNRYSKAKIKYNAKAFRQFKKCKMYIFSSQPSVNQTYCGFDVKWNLFDGFNWWCLVPFFYLLYISITSTILTESLIRISPSYKGKKASQNRKKRIYFLFTDEFKYSKSRDKIQKSSVLIITKTKNGLQ